MHIRISVATLHRALQQLKGVQAGKSSLPILSNVLIRADDRISLFSTDLAAAVTRWVDGTIATPGATTVNYADLLDIVSNAPKDATLDAELSGRLQIQIGHRCYELPTLDADEYPLAPAVPEGIAPVRLTAEQVRELADIAYAAATDTTRRVLTGVQLVSDSNAVRAAAADGFQAVLREMPALGAEFAVILPAASLAGLAKLVGDGETVELVIGPNQAFATVIDTDTVLLQHVTRIIDGAYPNVANIIPKAYSAHVTVTRAALVEAIKAQGFIAARTSNIIRLQFDPDHVLITTNSAETGTAQDVVTPASVSWESQEPKLMAAFNYQFLLAALTHINAPRVVLHLVNPTAPIVISPAGWEESHGNLRAIVMPMTVR
jgi:DNA polymerase-3 subunit beta